MAFLNEILLSSWLAISSATNCASVDIAFTSTILIFTSLPINFVTSAFKLSAPAPPFPIIIPGLAA